MSDSEIKLFYAQSSEVKNRILAPDEHLRAIDTGAYYVAGPDGKPQAVLTATTSAQEVEINVGGRKKRLIDTAPILDIVPTTWAELAGSAIYPICSRLEDDYTYGYSVAGLHRSTDGGRTWSPVGLVISQAQLLLKAGDGEALVVTNNNLYRTSGWGSPTITASIVLTLPSGYFQVWGIDTAPDVGRGICTHYGTDIGFVASRYVWHSSDYCQTWTIVRDDVALGTTDRHNHFAVFDPYANNRMYYIAHGDSGKNLSYSDDMGVTWEDVDNTYTDDTGTVNQVQCTTAVPTPAGLVMGDDDMWAGMFILSRDTGKIEKLCRGPEQPGVNLSVKSFATYAQYDKNRELVYTVWNQQEAGGVMYITATDGCSADVIYVHPESYPVTGYGGVQGLPGFFGFSLTSSEIVLVARRPSLITPADNARWLMRAPLPRRGLRTAVRDVPVYRGKSKPMNPAIWWSSQAMGLNGYASGHLAKALGVQNCYVSGNSAYSEGSFSHVTGHSASSGTFGYCTIYGDGGVATGAFATLTGYRAKGSANAVATGPNTSAENGGVCTGMGATNIPGSADGVAHGRNAKAGTNSCATGQGAEAGLSNQCVYGAGSKSTHSGANIFGQGLTSQRTNSTLFGDKDLELLGTGRGIITRSPNGTIYKVTVADGGTLTVTAI